jgi:hypothetical protein
MLRKIGLSTAAMLAAMALVQAPSAIAAGRDDFRARNSYSSGYTSGYRDDGYRDDVRYQSGNRSADRDDGRYVPQTRSARLRGRFEYNAPEWRGRQSQDFRDRDYHGDRR